MTRFEFGLSGYPILGGSNLEAIVAVSEKYPKLRVSLVSAPEYPERLIAFNYLKCLAPGKYRSPMQIPLNEAKEVTIWVLEGGHTPALESIYLGFSIDGMSKVISHQIVRHRVGISIGQQTQRAHSEEFLGKFYDESHYIEPPSFKNISEKLRDKLAEYYANAQELYNDLLAEGISEDDARYPIPQMSETSMTINIVYKSFMDSVASTRLCHIMQGEIVEMVRMMAFVVADYNELLGSYLMPVCMKYGKCNRNENNPTADKPKGACDLTIDGTVPVRVPKVTTFDLTKYSKPV
jgi:thymidylate synthase (FAD)